jgi:mannose-6-phosphate isomerase-like protein (cupin superfamily)
MSRTYPLPEQIKEFLNYAMNREISVEKAAEVLKESGNLFTEVFKHGSLVVEFYKPEKIDHQPPHDRDEIYVIASGTGSFCNGDNRCEFKPGDFLFVPAGVEHRFENFSGDFSTWVFFYGPVGGEAFKESFANK